jgi:hypothetical protein
MSATSAVGGGATEEAGRVDEANELALVEGHRAKGSVRGDAADDGEATQAGVAAA